MPLTIPGLVQKVAAEHAKKVVFYQEAGLRTERITFGEFYDAAARLHAFLVDLGLRRQDRIMIQGANGAGWNIVFLGCAMGGFVVVPVDMNAHPDFTSDISRIVKPRATFTSLKIKSKNTFSLEQIRTILPARRARPAAISGNSLFQIVYTSGTTGSPKGVMLTQHNLVSNVLAVRKVVDVRSTDRFLSVLPLSHLFEQTIGMLAPLSAGASIVYPEHRSSKAIVDALHCHKITHIIAVPVFLRKMRQRILEQAHREAKSGSLSSALQASRYLPVPLRRLLFRKIHDKLGGLKYMFVGGAPLDPEDEHFWTAIGIQVLQGYGLTEASPVVTANGLHSKKKGSVGKPIPGVDLRLGKEAEILVRGPNVTDGYYRQPSLSKKFYESGWYKTGDIGAVDEEGFVFVKGRLKNMILTSTGVNVYPEDVELILNNLPGIRDSCVLQQGEHIVAAILSDSKIEFEKVRRSLNRKLSDAAQVDQIIRWPDSDFPRTTTLKIKRRDISARLESRDTCSRATDDVLMNLLSKIADVPAGKIKESSEVVHDLHMDSLARIELLSQVEDTFNVEISEQDIDMHTKVKDIRAAIKRNEGIQRNLPFRKWALSAPVVIFRIVLQWGLFALMSRWLRLDVIGRDNLSGIDEPVLLVSNHTSHLDTPAILQALPLRFRRRVAPAAAMDYFFRNKKGTIIRRRLYAWFITLFLNAYPFSRDSTHFIRKSLAYTGKLMDNNFSILIFPEGTRNPSGKMGHFQNGIGLLSVGLKAPIVPIKVKNLDHIMPINSNKLHRGNAQVIFGEPISMREPGSIIKLTRQIEAAVRRL